MKKYTKAVLAMGLYLLLFGQAAGQTDDKRIIDITEKDRDGNWKDKNGIAKDKYKNNGIADINSILAVSLNHSALVSRAAVGLPPELANKLDALQKAVLERKANLQALEAISGSYNYELFESNDELYADYIQKFQVQAQKIEDLKAIDPRIRRYALEIEGYEFFFSRYYIAAERVLKEMEAEATTVASEKGVRVQFGAWLVRKDRNVELHLEGFDNVVAPEGYEVDRWQVMPTPEQLAQLKELQATARANKEVSFKLVKDFALNKVKNLLESTVRQLQDKIDEPYEELRALNAGNLEQFNTIVTDAKLLLKKSETFLAAMKDRISYYENLESVEDRELTTLLSKCKDDIDFLSSTMQEIATDATSLHAKIIILSAEGQNILKSLKLFAEEAKLLLTAEIKALLENAKQNASILFYGAKIDIEALKFSDKIYKLSLQEMPLETALDLYNSGVRSEGDRIVFKFNLSDRAAKVLVTESFEIQLFKVLPHITSTVGIIFADPFTSTKIQTQFQMAPYYNIIFKGFFDSGIRRRSVAYNRLFDWGAGLHVSAPDFDKDDVPELGVGVVVSLLHDYVQSGIAYNVFTADPYWFFGIRIPFPTFNQQ